MASSTSKVLYKLSKNHLKKYDGFQGKINSEVIIFTTADLEEKDAPKSLKHLCLPSNADYPIDLNQVEIFSHNLSIIEKFLKKDKKFLLEKSTKLKIVTQRAVLINIMLTTHRKWEWQVMAVKINNVLYLSKHVEHNGNDTLNRKFMKLCFSRPLDSKNDKLLKVAIQNHGVFRANLLNLNLLYSAEINGIEAPEKTEDLENVDNLNKCKFIQGKLRKASAPPFIIASYDRRWYYQALFSKKSDTVLGLYDENDVIRQPIEIIKMTDFKVEKTQNDLGFLHKILNDMFEVMLANEPDAVYEFKYEPDSRSIVYQIHTEDKKYKFLTDDFIANVQN